MNRVSVVVLCFLFCTISPMIAHMSSANLLDNGVTQEGDEFVLFNRLTDNSILTVDVNGNISKNTISAGDKTVSHDTPPDKAIHSNPTHKHASPK